MTAGNEFDWLSISKEEQLRLVCAAAPGTLRTMARSYDWSSHPEAVLGWIMAQKNIDLDSALTAFFHGDPGRFNYLTKREVPAEYRGVARLLDTICMRLNCGFYLAQKGRKPQARSKLAAWLEYQRADRKAGRSGRWVLDEGVIGPVLEEAQPPAPAEPRPDTAVLRPACEGAGGRIGRRLQGILTRLT